MSVTALPHNAVERSLSQSTFLYVFSQTMSCHSHGSCLSKASVDELLVQLNTWRLMCYFPFCPVRKNNVHYDSRVYKVQMLHHMGSTECSLMVKTICYIIVPSRSLISLNVFKTMQDKLFVVNNSLNVANL